MSSGKKQNKTCNDNSKIAIWALVKMVAEDTRFIIPSGARGVMVIVAGNGHGDTSSNPGRDWLHFTYD